MIYDNLFNLCFIFLFMSSSDITYLVCPQSHKVPYARWNFAKDDSEELIDADFRPMYESGLYCLECERAYGLSKLRESKSEK